MLWITQDRDWIDHIIEPGNSCSIERRGLVIVSAMTDAEFCMEKHHRCRPDQSLKPSRLRAFAERILRSALRKTSFGHRGRQTPRGPAGAFPDTDLTMHFTHSR